MISQLLFNGSLLLWCKFTRHDAINKGITKMVSSFQPVEKSGFQSILMCKFKYNRFQFISIIRNKFSRNDHHSFGRITIKQFVSLIKKSKQLSGIRRWWSSVNIILYKSNSYFRSV